MSPNEAKTVIIEMLKLLHLNTGQPFNSAAEAKVKEALDVISGDSKAYGDKPLELMDLKELMAEGKRVGLSSVNNKTKEALREEIHRKTSIDVKITGSDNVISADVSSAQTR